jgi:hypothetical protein
MAAAGQELLRFITCGSVDDGKSTLIGRLLHDTHQIFDDQQAALEADSARVGTQGEHIDFALLVDGLSAEREQGITIDVAYRYFGTDKRRWRRTAPGSGLRATTSTSPCWSTASAPSASRASPSTSPTAISGPTKGASSSPIPPATSNIPATW